MQDRGVQFAVVREDPRVELEVLSKTPRKRGLLIASGGCTALALSMRHPDLDLHLLDPNPAQLERTEAKRIALDSPDRMALLGVGTRDPTSLSQDGNFEKLFRGLRTFICEMIEPAESLEEAFSSANGPQDLLERLQLSPYWTVTFELFFSDSLLRAMFGDAAVQSAPTGSYPDYFRQVFERGLARADAHANPFLHHILLGRYLPEFLPEWLCDPRPLKPFEMTCGFLSAIPDLGRYDLIGLSNIFDWMPSEEVAAVQARLRQETREGTLVIWRQLHNQRGLASSLSDVFYFNPERERRLHAADRSLFYSSLHVGMRGSS
jgi:S-adenosylmethionine-diacylglycerol 3-amino-3-carboxypropyl transferase